VIAADLPISRAVAGTRLSYAAFLAKKSGAAALTINVLSAAGAVRDTDQKPAQRAEVNQRFLS